MVFLDLARAEDIPEIDRMCHALFKETGYSVMKYDKESVYTMAESIIKGDRTKACILVLRGEDGKLAGVLVSSVFFYPFNRWQKGAVELALWLDEEHRNSVNYRKLIKGMTYWAKKIGCEFLQIGKIKDKQETYRIIKLWQQQPSL